MLRSNVIAYDQIPCSETSSSTILHPVSMKKCIVLLLLYFRLNLATLFVDAIATFAGNETDEIALLEFKAKIALDPQSAMTSWNHSVHFCNWEGITCGRRHKRVTILDLRSKDLVGSLSPYIGNMSFLREIRLTNNSLQGEIPAEVGRLFRLQVLHLLDNQLEGKIPTNLSRCSRLIILHLGRNILQGNIPAELATLLNLIELSIHENYLTGPITPFIGNLTSLQVLSMAKNLLTGSIPNALGKLDHLSEIGLGSNNFSGIIPPLIYNISSITVFAMGNNFLHGNLPSDIGNLLPKLEFFQLDNNNLSGTIPASLSNASKLYYIELLSNNFIGEVPAEFGVLQHLRDLNLNLNFLGGQGDDDFNFVTSFANCSSLTRLQLSYNQLTGTLPDSIANLSSTLENLLMEHNHIYGSLPPGLSALVNLGVIALEDNQITGTIPKEIGQLQKLGILHVGKNRLSGEIPSTIGNLSSLIRFQGDLNNLQGSIPSSLGNCNKLLFLHLFGNNLTGSIPKELFSNSSNLVILTLSVNHFVGSLPSEIGNLFHLNVLLISLNMLSGEIPKELDGCSSLEILYMNHNNFQNTIPTSLESLRGLREFDLSKNNLSGKIPEYLGTFALEYLNFSFNDFEGEVPIKGVFANGSAISLEGNSKLCGGMPEIRLPRCIIQVSKRRKISQAKIIVIIISCIASAIMLSAFLYCWFKKQRRQQSPESLLLESFRKLSYERLLKATDGFSTSNLIGAGRFGSVYKGILDEEDQEIIAVKVLNLQQRGAAKSFLAECKVLQNIRHRNLVRIVTSCSSIDFQGNDFKALAYEYMPNGSLEKWLHPSSQVDTQPIEQQSLNLLQRMNIAIDVGNALHYLHHNCEQPIIHCDLKPSNILLDHDMVGHIGDFGLAKIVCQLTNPTQSSSVGVRGTIGYAAPEYGLGCEPTTSGDVYAFGILMLEMVTGKKPTDNIFVEGINLHNFSGMALPNQVLEIADPILLQEDEATLHNRKQPMAQARNDSKAECLIGLIKVGIACSMECPQDRIDIRKAVTELNSIKNNYMQLRRA